MRVANTRRCAVTLIEVVTVTVAGSLLASMLLLLVTQAGGKRSAAKCLSNLKRFGTAAHMYAAEDPRELLTPIHARMVRPSETWFWRTVHAFAWGGASAAKPFQYGPDSQVYLNDRSNQGAGTPGAAYAANTRPLNPYLIAAEKERRAAEKELKDHFECPADAGYPDDPAVTQSPRANAGRACYDTLGNSYRMNVYALYRENGEALSLGLWAQRLSTVKQPAETVAYFEAPFMDMALAARADAAEPTLKAWHSGGAGANVLIADGSARNLQKLAIQTGDALNFAGLPPQSTALLLRGERWMIDTFPAPGVGIFGEWPGDDFPDLAPNAWPIQGMRWLKKPR